MKLKTGHVLVGAALLAAVGYFGWKEWQKRKAAGTSPTAPTQKVAYGGGAPIRQEAGGGGTGLLGDINNLATTWDSVRGAIRGFGHAGWGSEDEPDEEEYA